MSEEFDDQTEEVSTSGNIAVPVATALVVFLVGLIAGAVAVWALMAPEEVEVVVPRDLTAEELAEACGPLIAEAAENLDEAEAKVSTLEKRVADKEAQVAEMEAEMKRRASRGAAMASELEDARAELDALRIALAKAVEEKAVLEIELSETKEELVVQKKRTRLAREDALLHKWKSFVGTAKIDICDRGNRRKLGRCRETIDEFLADDMKEKFDHCVRSGQAVPSVRMAERDETLPAYAEYLDQDNKVTRDWYVLLCDPTLPEAMDFADLE
ncbi:MAG: hypothetical protein EP330_24830 [Deltaproteobacteria bacterium]|nr:MAG: hypothetical protein EP330_24830 [Deltaproteobacteria bacterium]